LGMGGSGWGVGRGVVRRGYYTAGSGRLRFGMRACAPRPIEHLH